MTADTWTCHGRHVAKGTELSVRGARGRFRFQRYVVTAKGEWIDVYGGPDGREMFRSFAPERVTTVHRTIKARTR